LFGREVINMDDHQPQRHGLTLDEAASYVGVSPTTLRTIIERGELPAARVGGPQKGRLILLRDDLDQFLEQQQKVFEESRTQSASGKSEDQKSLET
jgi:excisionase family DNA binding protein